MIKLLFISILLFSQVYSFCVYNKLTDGSSFQVTQEMGGGALPGKVFTKKMEPGDRRCCNYTEKDCSSNQQNDLMVIFAVSLDFMTRKNIQIELYGRCTTGGAFIISGDANDFFYECIDADNNSNLHRLATMKTDLYIELGKA